MPGWDANDERRVAPRYDADTLAAPVVCRVNPGHEVQLANVSAVGARVEATFPLLPGRPLQLHVQSPGRRVVIETRVAWCAVTGVTPSRGVRYAAGLAFARWIDLATDLAARIRPAPPPVHHG
jgi:PilZ domain